MKSYKLFLALVLSSFSAVIAQTKWNVDASHTNIGFEVDHMVIASVEGEFAEFDASVESEGNDFTNADIKFTADIESISTDNEKRDEHLKSDDFFNAEKFPQLTFVSKSMTKVDGNDWKLVGDLTIRDVTKEVTLDVEFRGLVKDPWGNTRVGFEINGELNRFDYNLKWNKLLETGGLVVGEKVEININIELIKATGA